MCTASQGQGQLNGMMAHGSLDAAWDDRQLTALPYWMRWQHITTAARGGCSSIAHTALQDFVRVSCSPDLTCGRTSHASTFS